MGHTARQSLRCYSTVQIITVVDIVENSIASQRSALWCVAQLSLLRVL